MPRERERKRSVPTSKALEEVIWRGGSADYYRK